MTVSHDATAQFAQPFYGYPKHDRGLVNALRLKGIQTFQHAGLPTTKLEAWRNTSIAPIIETRFSTVTPIETNARNETSSAAKALFEQYSFRDDAACELVFVNGRFEPRLSTPAGHSGVIAVGLSEAIRAKLPLVDEHLGKHAKIEQHAFAALNTGYLDDGAFVSIGRGVVCGRPIHLLFLSVPTSDGMPAIVHPRVLIVAEENSESSIVETYVGTPGSVYFTNAVTEIVQAPSAKIDHNKFQQESEAAFHVALMQVDLEAASLFVSHSTSMGSRLTRNDLQVFMGGERAEATLSGLVYARGSQHIDNHTLLQHEKANCPSHELYKHVLADKASAVFMGKIFVQKDAQKTDSKQTSKALLLSNEATMNSQPALEIYADDVKCTHGSTTGPVDENAVFYLVSRGLSLAQARHLMTYAFAADITRRIRVTPVRARIEDFMAQQHGLPQDLRITEEAAHDVAML